MARATNPATFESLTADRQIFMATVNKAGSLSVPRVIAELNGWHYNEPLIYLRLQRPGMDPWEDEYDLRSGHEVTYRKRSDDDRLREMLKRGARVRVTVAKTGEGLNTPSWWPQYAADARTPYESDED